MKMTKNIMIDESFTNLAIWVLSHMHSKLRIGAMESNKAIIIFFKKIYS